MMPEPRSQEPAEGATVATRRVYTGRVLNLDVDTVRFPNGSTGELEIIRHPGASAVVPFVDSFRGPDPQILLIRQYRYAAGRYIYEIPAGRLETGERPDDCARRELLEETGTSARELVHLGGFFTTPGFIDEFIHLFAAVAEEVQAASPEADEFISVDTRSFSEVKEMVRTGRIVDGKTIVALHLAEKILGL